MLSALRSTNTLPRRNGADDRKGRFGWNEAQGNWKIRREMNSLLRSLMTISWPILAMWLPACGSVTPVIKVGLVGPFEGRDRAVGYDVIYSARAMATAYSLSNDPAVVAVIGHWLPEASAAAAPIYAEAGLPFLETGVHPFAVSDPSELPADFLAAYEATTPFDEVAGPHAAASYDAFQLMWRALSEASEVGGTLERSAVDLALAGLEIEGLKGTVYRP
jgi:hypothetical protein